MIVGHGDIASVLPNKSSLEGNWLQSLLKPRLVFFASGVSNSQETREEEFEREQDLVLQFHPEKDHIVYFSSLSVFYNDNRYTTHKREMENLIISGFRHWTIMRLGNITWGNNPNTLINYVRNKIKNSEPFETRDEYRYIIDKDEFLHWINLIPEWNCEMNITGNRMKVADIITKYGYLDNNT